MLGMCMRRLITNITNKFLSRLGILGVHHPIRGSQAAAQYRGQPQALCPIEGFLICVETFQE